MIDPNDSLWTLARIIEDLAWEMGWTEDIQAELREIDREIVPVTKDLE